MFRAAEMFLGATLEADEIEADEIEADHDASSGGWRSRREQVQRCRIV